MLKLWLLRLLGIPVFGVPRVGKVAILKCNGRLSGKEIDDFTAAFSEAFRSPLKKAGFSVGDAVLFQPYPEGTPKKAAKIACDCSAHDGGGYVLVRWSDEVVRNERLALGYWEPGTAYAEIDKLEKI